MRLVFGLLLFVAAVYSFGQQVGPTEVKREFNDAELPVQGPAETEATSRSPATLPDAPSHVARQKSLNGSVPQHEQDDSLVLNTRSQSPLATPFPLTSGQSLAAQHGANFSSFVYQGGTANPSDARQRTETGVTAPGKTCVRVSTDKADGGDWITSLLSMTSHGGNNYCALGEGGFWKRSTYAATRAMVAHRYNGMNSFDPSQRVPGAGAIPGFPSNLGASRYQYDAGQRLASRYGYAVGRDALRNMFTEFSTRVMRRRP